MRSGLQGLNPFTLLYKGNISAGNMQGQRRKNTTPDCRGGQGVEIFSPLWSKIAVYVPLHIPGRYITFAA